MNANTKKFSAQCFADFTTPIACYARIVRNSAIAVIIEADDGSWCELDAESQLHADALARNWVDVLGARGASCWHVLTAQGGRLAIAPFLTHYQSLGD